jgi:hypothetical protein
MTDAAASMAGPETTAVRRPCFFIPLAAARAFLVAQEYETALFGASGRAVADVAPHAVLSYRGKAMPKVHASTS